MTDGEALLKAIIAQPDEDVPRLAFADWLTENGQPERGEFVRVQVELARVEHVRLKNYGDATLPIVRMDCRYNCRACQLGRHARELFDGFGLGEERSRAFGLPDVCYTTDDLKVSLPWPGGPWPLLAAIARGFAEEIHGPAADWLAHADAILAAHPVRAVTLTTMPGIEEKTAISLTAPPGWACAFGIHGCTWTWEKLGKPDIDPNDNRAVVLAILKAQWPTVKTWNLPPPEPAVTGLYINRGSHDNPVWELAANAAAGELVYWGPSRRQRRSPR